MASERARPRELLLTASCAAALFAINALLTSRLFHAAYIDQMGSIEAVFIGLARYIRDHFSDLQWFPLWYGGIPFQDSYPPLLHFLVAATPLAPAHAYHAVTATLYALGPVALFWCAWRLGAGRASAFTAALLYSLISPACFLIREVRADTGGWFGPRRLVTLVHYGEGPHTTSMLLLPVAIVLVHLAMQKRQLHNYFLAALGLAAVVLSNWIGGFALALALAAYAATLPARDWPRLAAIGIFAYAIAFPWIPPSTIATIRANAPLVGGRFTPNPPLMAAFAAAFLLLAWLVPARFRFPALFLYGTAFLALGAYWFKLSLLPQPQRYHLEMDLAIWLAAALLVPRLPRAVPIAVVALCVPLFLHQRALARDMEKPIDIRATAEYRVSTWLGANLPGRRVFAPGTIGFWMNAFSDTPMLPGGFDNGIRNPILQDVNFQIYYGEKPQVALDWLAAFGCDAIVGGAAASGEFYHPYAHPDKFAGLPELWHDGPEVIYSVPRVHRSLAHAIHLADVPTVTPPGYDTAPIQPYLRAIDDPAAPEAEFRWTSLHSARIGAPLRPEHVLSVQITYDAGWHARVNGEPRRIWGDKLGQAIVEPRCDGPCVVDLDWDGGAEMAVARWTSRLALCGGFLWVVLWRIRRSGSTKTN